MGHPDTEFKRLYTMLNKEQKDAVDTIEGPVMVIAGPGTGKTQILTLRIANILKQTDVPADAILALTFTNAAAMNMRKRLVSIIGSDAYRVSIFTFHSFAHHLIETHPETFADAIGKSNCSEVERIDIVRSLLDTGRFTILRPMGEPYHNVTQIISAISHLKREGLTPKTFSDWIEKAERTLNARDDLYHEKGAHRGKMKSIYLREQAQIDKNKELADMYARYQEALAKKKRYDFDDSLLMLIEAMETNENFLRELQEEYQYFLVDEHQDTNGAQNRILELLATFFDSPNLFVVGDEKQAVFRFQGASLANFLYFEKTFQNVKRITLGTNYRSHQKILDGSHALIEHNTERIEAPLVAHTPPEKDSVGISVFTFDADDEELLFLAESVRSLITEGIPLHEIAVLYRNNRDVDAIADYFERLSIPFLIESGHGVLDDPDIRKINLLLKALPDFSCDALAKVLFIDFLNIPVEDSYSILSQAKGGRETVFSILQRTALQRPSNDPLRKLTSALKRWKKDSENLGFLYLFENVVRDSGVLEHIQHSSFHTEKFDKLVRLFDEMKSHVKRNPFFSIQDYEIFLNILEDHSLTLEAKSRQVPNSVRLMTAHKAKGLEFDYVFIVHAYDGHWGGKRQRNYFLLPHRVGADISAHNDTEDERRLFYVALTRARKEVYISYASQAPDGRDRVPCQFVEEIRDDLKTVRSGRELGYAGRRPPLFVTREGRHGKEKYKEFINATFSERGLSATALNNFLTCPWRWFYENFFHTQFVPTFSQLKGTAVHASLEEFFNARNKNPQINADDLVRLFGKHLEELDVAPQDMARIHTEMSEALRGWYTKWSGLWETKTVNEVMVKGILFENSILLNGKIDKMECLDDRCHEVRVVDYKTGAPKSRNVIEGTTATLRDTPGSGGYKRQLVFYKLLLDRYAEGKYTMREGVIDFVEPTKNGTYKKEVFTITHDEVGMLEHEIRTVADTIRNATFWDTRCGDTTCEYCALRDLMEEQGENT